MSYFPMSHVGEQRQECGYVVRVAGGALDGGWEGRVSGEPTSN
jgi:hypothetical protein